MTGVQTCAIPIFAVATKAAINNSVATWSGNVPLAEAITPASGNNTVEGAYRLMVIASASIHDSLGAPTGQNTLDTLIVARPDSAVSLSFQESINATDSLGPVSVTLTLKDQDFVGNRTDEAITATALCAGSSTDSVPQIGRAHV